MERCDQQRAEAFPQLLISVTEAKQPETIRLWSPLFKPEAPHTHRTVYLRNVGVVSGRRRLYPEVLSRGKRGSDCIAI